MKYKIIGISTNGVKLCVTRAIPKPQQNLGNPEASTLEDDDDEDEDEMTMLTRTWPPHLTTLLKSFVACYLKFLLSGILFEAAEESRDVIGYE